MGYQIQYGPVKYKKRQKKEGKHARGLLILMCALVLIAGLHFSGLDSVIKAWLLPGDPEVTAAALEHFVTQIRDGSAISEAITAFCEEIVENAVYPQ